MTDTESPAFYSLPAHLLTKGLSTADGQDIVKVTGNNSHVFAEVYTPRSDDPELDADNLTETETRLYRCDETVDLGVFAGTPVDGRHLPNNEVHAETADEDRETK